MALTHGAFGNSIFNTLLLSSAFDPLENLSLFDRMLSSFPRELNTVGSARVETPGAHVLEADLPGMKKEEIKVQIVDDGVLSSSGKVNKKDSYRKLNNQSYGEFHRQFKLPSNAKVQDVSAKVKNGVLTVTKPKLSDFENSG